MKKKILIGVGLYLAAGVVTAAVLARGHAFISKAEAVALWPGWIYVHLSGRDGSKSANGGQSTPGTRIVVPDHLQGVTLSQGIRAEHSRA